ncbi:hypothetical protein PIB19_05680 [Sphingomonas sp. 7/4-4]|uniref:hypothetical protein n=1 Tax=Sphingomonas sp. 7/4-4 TaxID=3018446 RepID=UPI0022F3ABB9|nr:hypothetical protein [Sphingomonas sp. 7/4-4]WBY08898.1 hypothetical protein PIB19_05680 [Sphingomonas sp. 7/4-4]
MRRLPVTSDNASSTDRLFRLSVGIFFMGGFVTSLVSLLGPRLTLIDKLDYTSGALVQLAFHSSYLLFALPITAMLVRIGYMRSISLGLVVMASGCLGLAGAAWAASYPVVLVALLSLSAGITFLQIAANVIQPVLERSGRGISRLTLLQGFNSIGTVLAPLIGAGFLLGSADVRAGAPGWLTLALPSSPARRFCSDWASPSGAPVHCLRSLPYHAGCRWRSSGACWPSRGWSSGPLRCSAMSGRK